MECVLLALSSITIRQRTEPPIAPLPAQRPFLRTGTYRLTFPLPPLAEQQRIVAKVEELMRWCDQLEAHLATARTTATHLLDATLAKLTTNP